MFADRAPQRSCSQKDALQPVSRLSIVAQNDRCTARRVFEKCHVMRGKTLMSARSVALNNCMMQRRSHLLSSGMQLLTTLGSLPTDWDSADKMEREATLQVPRCPTLAKPLGSITVSVEAVGSHCILAVPSTC
jgi:hypothetical protein